MQNRNISVSDNFRKMTVRAIFSIALFGIVYILLLGIAVCLTILCTYGGLKLIVLKPAFYTLLIGLGLISMGILVLIFLVKFIFKKHNTDRSHLIEITKTKEPKLFAFIDEVVNEANTDFPKKIYISSDVNASVFYESSFWSMFLPIQKNLQIGIGLVNAVSVTELKAVLAHEFGHFSQRTMKVGSYVYHVNQVIYNMLYDNESFDSLAEKWGNFNMAFAFFASLAVKIARGIQWVLRKMYEVVNLSYMSLSREMEFHADEVAATIAGSKPLTTALLRLDLANYSYMTVINYYNSKISDSIKTKNIYPQQHYVMSFIAKESQLPIENNLPQVSLDHLSRYNKSKLVIKNQWESHPSTEDRIRELKRLNIETAKDDAAAAVTLFRNIDELQTKMTEKIFSTVTYTTTAIYKGHEQFIEDYTQTYKQNSFSKLFNNYYDDKNPALIEIETTDSANPNADGTTLNTLFGNDAVDMVYTSLSLESDINTLNEILKGDLKVKSFDYNGNKYSSRNCKTLIPKLEAELNAIKEKIANHDIDIYQYFFSLAVRQGKEHEFKSQCERFFMVDKAYRNQMDIFMQMITESQFLHQTTPFQKIEENLAALKKIESTFKGQIASILREEVYQSELTAEIKGNFMKYLSKDWTYFTRPEYDQAALNVLSDSLHHYQFVLSKAFFRVKKELLEYQAGLVQS